MYHIWRVRGPYPLGEEPQRPSQRRPSVQGSHPGWLPIHHASHRWVRFGARRAPSFLSNRHGEPFTYACTFSVTCAQWLDRKATLQLSFIPGGPVCASRSVSGSSRTPMATEWPAPADAMRRVKSCPPSVSGLPLQSLACFSSSSSWPPRRPLRLKSDDVPLARQRRKRNRRKAATHPRKPTTATCVRYCPQNACRWEDEGRALRWKHGKSPVRRRPLPGAFQWHC